jgi:hypothetical protein
MSGIPREVTEHKLAIDLVFNLKDQRRRPEGVNVSQSKFLEETRSMSQTQSDTHLF